MTRGLFEITDDDITTKTKFVRELRKFVRDNGASTDDGYDRGWSYQPSRGEVTLVRAIADYFDDHPEIVDQDIGINWLADLGKHLVDAFVEFRTLPKYEALREQYQLDGAGMHYEIPDLLDLCGGFQHGHVTHDLARLMPILAGRCGGEWLERDLTCRFGAEAMVIDHAWRRFVRICYRPIAPRIKAERHRGNSGLFGRTTLRSYALAGRVMFTFSRTSSVSDVLAKVTELVNTTGVTDENKVAALEALLMIVPAPDEGPDVQSVSFVADESDMYGFRSGLNYPHTPYAECVAMINDVTDNWDSTKFVENGHVRLAGMP